MANVTAIRVALAAQIGQYAYPPLRSLPEPEDQVNPPIGIVMPGRPYLTYGTTLQGASQFLGAPAGRSTIAPTLFTLDYLVIIAKASTLERVSSTLDQWLGAESDGTAVSVVAAVGVDPRLGGLVEWCEPLTADPPGPLEWSGPECFGARIHFSISAP